MLPTTRQRIDGHWARRFGAPVPGLVPVTVAPTGRCVDAALVVLLGDHAYVDPPLAQLDAVAALALAHQPGQLVDPTTWAPLASETVVGPADHFWADHATALEGEGAQPLEPEQLGELRARVDEDAWHEAGFDRDPQASFGVAEGGRLVAASVLTSLWGWPVDVGVLVAPESRGRGLGVRVAAAALAAGMGLSGFAVFRVGRANRAGRGVAARLGLEAYGANLAVPLAH